MISTRTRVAAVIGWPVEHSLSPALHNAAFAATGIDAVYVATPVAPGDLAAALSGMRVMRYLGASITVPHKRAALDLCDRLDSAATRVGAVNCVSFENRRVVGHNTDAAGFVDGLGNRQVAGKRAVLLGAGGAARAVHAGLSAAGCLAIEVIARSPGRVDWVQAWPWTDQSLARALSDCELLVDCTSTGLDPAREADIPAPVPLDALPRSAVVCSLVYHRVPALLETAAARGLETVDGSGMLVHQAARAFELWTGCAAPLEAMWSAMRAATARS